LEALKRRLGFGRVEDRFGISRGWSGNHIEGDGLHEFTENENWGGGSQDDVGATAIAVFIART
jgi:hypothetical protein